MNDPLLSTRRQLELLQQLQELANQRAQAETQVADTLATELRAAESNYQGHTARLNTDFGLRREQLKNDFAEAQQQAQSEHHNQTTQLHQQFEQTSAESEDLYKKTALAIQRKHKESQWQALAVFDAAKDQPQQMLDQAGKRFSTRHQQVEGLRRDASTLLAMRRLLVRAKAGLPAEELAAEGLPQPGDSHASAEQLQQENLKQLHAAVLTLQNQRLPSLFLEGVRPWGWWLGACLTAGLLSGVLLGWSPVQTPLVGLGLGTLLALAFALVVGKRAQQQSLTQYAQIVGLLQQSQVHELAAQEEARAQSQAAADKINQEKNDALGAARTVRDLATAKNEARQQQQQQQAQTDRDAGLAASQQKHDQAIAAAQAHYPPLLDALDQAQQAQQLESDAQYQQRKTQTQRAHDAAWQQLADHWRSGFQTITDELARMRTLCQQLFPDWSVTPWSDWQRPTDPPAAIQFGTAQLPLSAVKNGISADPRLQPEPQQIKLPALMPLEELPRLVVTAEGEGRPAAVELLQAMMLRFLTVMPAGKLRFTVMDPSALGENFASFMHLADYDEALIGRKIWTDPQEIDARLTLLSDHMEHVLQKYLRNEFSSLQAYNRQAGEVAEPYHVLVVANFPTGLSELALRKLQTIATAGPRCGVYTLLSVDTSVPLPPKFDLSPLLDGAVHLQWENGQLKWNYPLFAKLPLTVDQLPPREPLNRLLRAAGEDSHQASRVEVPFQVVAPPPGKLCQGSTARELVVPIGRAGAKNLQTLRLGRGTSQHVLISGKTGSGKSTLLHALITNLALHYSPDEVEFYLVDFKKGVEFKAYATGQLPHARVIAIESEREFGVSVLERLDQELRSRGERFRELGVQDLAGLREACPDRMPRVLLVIDEFQELFVTDDRLSQDAALLLDRLVRQGRAFGIHVLLGSQTLAGAYSLARSTIGQMAVRIALECSDADAHLILSDENSAARLLSRPGEAIYNDQNGLVEGNNPFQVVWLPDAERQVYLAQIRQQIPADQLPPEPVIVFEGNVAANPNDNQPLRQLIHQTAPDAHREPILWLGSAVRIEPPTQLTFRRQSGNHLLLVGQEEPLALGMLATAVVALVAQQPSSDPCVTVLNGTRPESSERSAWPELATALSGRVVLEGPDQAAEVIAALTEEVARRSTDATPSSPAHFLVIHDLAQFRSLRMTEETFSFSASSSNQSASVDKQFRNLLREGPAVGIHVLVWCDSYNGLMRFIDRATLRELDYRVAMQMSAADSTSLMDSPAAGRIGEQRAVFYRDDLGTEVKFRPYGRPTTDWLAQVAQQLESGSSQKP